MSKNQQSLINAASDKNKNESSSLSSYMSPQKSAQKVQSRPRSTKKLEDELHLFTGQPKPNVEIRDPPASAKVSNAASMQSARPPSKKALVKKSTKSEQSKKSVPSEAANAKSEIPNSKFNSE